MFLTGNGFGLDAWVYAPDGTLLLDAFSHDDANEAFTQTSIDEILLVHDGLTGQRLNDGRLLAAVRTSGQVTHTIERFPLGSANVTEQPLAFSGAATFPGGLVFDLATCEGTWFDVKVQIRNPASPHPLSEAGGANPRSNGRNG